MSEKDAIEEVSDTDGAIWVLLERSLQQIADTCGPEVTHIWPDLNSIERGRGVRVGQRITDRPDGLSPAGWRIETVLTEPDYGCLPPSDPFALPKDRAD